MPNQLSPFIALTTTRGKRILVNINHIVCYEDQTYSDSDKRITYITLNSTATCTVHVKENYDHVASLISKYHA